MSDSEVSDLRQHTLSVLLSSHLVAPDNAVSLQPGSTHYLLSLARVALSACVEIPDLWGGTHGLLRCLLRCPQYEVRELGLGGLLTSLDGGGGTGRRPAWLDETTMSDLTGLALHETHPQCLAKVGPHTH